MSGPVREAQESRLPISTSQIELWYVEKLFAYTNQLIERTQQRSNYLLFSNSVSAVAFTSIINLVITNHVGRGDILSLPVSLLVALIPIALFLISIFLAVLSFLPKVYKTDIDINHHFIAAKSVESYMQFVETKPDSARIGDFVREIHILSNILNDKNRIVGHSAKVFLLSVASMVVVTTLMIA